MSTTCWSPACCPEHLVWGAACSWACRLCSALSCVQIPHLVELGINCVELLPVLEYDELEFQRSPNPRDHMVNIWGYSHISFMAPMARFAAGGAGVLVRVCQSQ